MMNNKANPILLLMALVLAILLVSCSGSNVTVTVPDIQPGAECPQLNPHPIGMSISEKFEIPYEEVMEWFCEGETFEDILLALETKELTGRTLEELFAMKDQKSWEDVWRELGIVP